MSTYKRKTFLKRVNEKCYWENNVLNWDKLTAVFEHFFVLKMHKILCIFEEGTGGERPSVRPEETVQLSYPIQQI